jgi:hypothetical protein
VKDSLLKNNSSKVLDKSSKTKTRLDKKKIFGLYQYYFLGKINQAENEKKLLSWFNECLVQENFLRQKVASKLKKD